MVYPTQRSMNSELNEGASDGRYKKIIQNRGGMVERGTWDNRDELDDVWFGLHEVNPKDIPGKPGYHSTPYYTPTREPDMTKW